MKPVSNPNGRSVAPILGLGIDDNRYDFSSVIVDHLAIAQRMIETYIDAIRAVCLAIAVLSLHGDPYRRGRFHEL